MKIVGTLPFVRTYSTLKGRHSLTARAYVPRAEMNSFLQFLSSLTRRRILDGFFILVLEPLSILRQTLGYKAYSDTSGWSFDNREHVRELRNLMGKHEAGKVEQWNMPVYPLATMS